MSTAVLADPQFGIARILKPSKEALGATSAYSIVEEFTVPSTAETNFTIQLSSIPTGLPNDKFITIPNVGTFRVVSKAGSTVTLVTAPFPVEYGWQSFNETGTFSAGYFYVAAGTYVSRPGTIPMMWSEGGLPLDPNAGKPGYSNRLVRGLQVPMGARMLIWVPEISGCNFVWNFAFRVRNLLDYKNTRSPYHLAAQRNGPDGLAPIPGIWQNVVYNDSTSSACKPLATQTVTREAFVGGFSGDTAVNFPLIPSTVSLENDNMGLLEQGVHATSWPAYGVLTFKPIELQALGDEMLVSCSLADGADAIWEPSLVTTLKTIFSSETAPYNGVYVFAGSAP
jgi:hypothetical protein